MTSNKPSTITEQILPPESSLLDIIDNVLAKGVVLRGDVVLGVAGIDLVYLQLSALLCSADRVFRKEKERDGGAPK